MSKNLKGCFSHKSDDWSTPKELYEDMINDGYFDPCPLHSSFDGLSIDWPEKVFVNPPYSNISKFVDKALYEIDSHHSKRVYFLVPVRTDTRWFKKLYDHIWHITFIIGRLKFGNSKLCAPFPSMLILVSYKTLIPPLFNLVDRTEYE